MNDFKRILAAAGERRETILNAARKVQGLSACAEIDTFHLDDVRSGDLLDQLVERCYSTRADLLIVGARKHKIASRAAMLAPCSVLMVPEGTAVSFEKILIPVDSSDSSAEAVRYATSLAARAEGDWRAVTIETPDEPWLEWEEDEARLLEKMESFVATAAESPARGRCLVEPLRRAERFHEEVDVAGTILEVARREKATLIALGTRGRTRSAAVLLGSVTEAVMRLSTLPVLVVKHAGSPMNVMQAVWEKLSEPSTVVN